MAMWGVTLRSRRAATKASTSNSLSAPRVIRRSPGRWRPIRSRAVMRRLRDIAGDGEPVAVLHQYVAHVAEPTLLAVALAVKLGIDIGRARMGLIRALRRTE